MAKTARKSRTSRPRTRRRPQTARTGPTAQPRMLADSGLAPGMQPLSTFLAVANIAATLDFLEKVLGFTRGIALTDADGQLRYAEMRHGDAAVMLVRRGDGQSPSQGGHSLYTYVGDVDRAIAHARDAGAAVGEIEDKPWGDRVGTITDPDGYRWLVATFKKLVPFVEA